MYYSSTIFGQLLAFLPNRNSGVLWDSITQTAMWKKMTVWNQLVCSCTRKRQARKACETSRPDSAPIRKSGTISVCKAWHVSTVARANNTRDYRIFERLFYALLAQCKDITPERTFTFDNPLYALDATTITLCLSLFDWAYYSHEKGAIKIHTVINNRTTMPEVLTVTDGK